jgi:hypothetical protein
MMVWLGALQNRGEIRPKYVIDRYDSKLMLYCLTDQHSIEWVTVNRWEHGKPLNTGFIQGQNCDPVSFALGWQISFRGLWQWQLSELVFKDTFPK